MTALRKGWYTVSTPKYPVARVMVGDNTRLTKEVHTY